MKDIILTGDRPTGNLHLGHYVGSVQNRVNLQNQGSYDKFYIMIADTQALTDNADRVDKVKNNIIQVAIDYISAGIDPNKVNIFIQSMVSELHEFSNIDLSTKFSDFYWLIHKNFKNQKIQKSPKTRGFEKSLPMGFLTYPISQAADILAFGTTIVPVGDDQLPMIEQAREIVSTFNYTYSPSEEVFAMPKPLLSADKICRRLPGLDGKLKMSKSYGNAIYLCDTPEVVRQKVMSAYTDPNHIRVSDPGQIEGNMVFSYLDAFCKDEHFARYLPEYENLDSLKDHYKKGGLGDVKIKKFLIEILEELLTPIRAKRAKCLENIDGIYNMLFENSYKASIQAKERLERMKDAMGINYKNLLK